jgi:hypothetical protein
VTGKQRPGKLEQLAAEHPDWTIRRDAGPDWVCWTAQRVQVIMAPTLDELTARLGGDPAGDPRVAAARELLAEHHQPLVMTPGDLRTLLARYQRAVAELLDVLGQDARKLRKCQQTCLSGPQMDRDAAHAAAGGPSALPLEVALHLR